MKYIIACLFALFAIAAYAKEQEIPRVTLQTTMGKIVLELMPNESPIATTNFLNYANAGFYEGTIFHRVVKDFVVQGGGYTAGYEEKPTDPPIKNEANNGVKNLRGTVAMARSSDPNSATSQFFINVNDNGFLDYKSPTTNGWGYTVFAKVVEGMEIIDVIQDVETGAAGSFRRNVPLKPISIEAVTVDSVMREVEIGEKPALDTPVESYEPTVDETYDPVGDATDDEDATNGEDAANDEVDETVDDGIDSNFTVEGEAMSAPDAPSKPDLPEPMTY